MGEDELVYGEGVGTVSDFFKKYLSVQERWMLENPENQVCREYVARNLPEDKRRIIKTGAKDEVIFSLIEVMIWEEKVRIEKEKAEGKQPPSRFSMFDCLFPKTNKDHSEYLRLNQSWMKEERWLLHTADDITLIRDYEKNMNGCRARVYYSLKYPERVDLQHNLQDGCIRKIPCAIRNCNCGRLDKIVSVDNNPDGNDNGGKDSGRMKQAS